MCDNIKSLGLCLGLGLGLGLENVEWYEFDMCKLVS